MQRHRSTKLFIRDQQDLQDKLLNAVLRLLRRFAPRNDIRINRINKVVG